MNRKISILTIVAILFGFVGQFAVAPVEAAGVTIYADLVASINYNNGAATNDGLNEVLSVITTEPEMAVSTSTEIYFSFMADAQYVPGDNLTFTFPTDWATAVCATDTTNADADATVDGSFTHSGATTSTYTFSATTTMATMGGEGVEFCVKATSPATASNEVMVLVSSSVEPTTGAVLIYVGDANDVIITADVEQNLYFVIKDALDTTTTNACDLLVLTAGSVNTCSYRLAIGTAAQGGYTAYIKDTSATSGLRNAVGDEINPIVESANRPVQAGNEEYGISLVGATTTLTAEEPIFDDDDSPIPTSKTPIMIATSTVGYTAADLGTSSLITHRASIDATTPSGHYTQTVSYYVTANY